MPSQRWRTVTRLAVVYANTSSQSSGIAKKRRSGLPEKTAVWNLLHIFFLPHTYFSLS